MTPPRLQHSAFSSIATGRPGKRKARHQAHEEHRRPGQSRAPVWPSGPLENRPPTTKPPPPVGRGRGGAGRGVLVDGPKPKDKPPPLVLYFSRWTRPGWEGGAGRWAEAQGQTPSLSAGYFRSGSGLFCFCQHQSAPKAGEFILHFMDLHL